MLVMTQQTLNQIKKILMTPTFITSPTTKMMPTTTMTPTTKMMPTMTITPSAGAQEKGAENNQMTKKNVKNQRLNYLLQKREDIVKRRILI